MPLDDERTTTHEETHPAKIPVHADTSPEDQAKDPLDADPTAEPAFRNDPIRIFPQQSLITICRTLQHPAPSGAEARPNSTPPNIQPPTDTPPPPQPPDNL